MGECPLLNDFREGLKKSVSNHVNLTTKNETRLCKTSRNYCSEIDKNKEKNDNEAKMSNIPNVKESSEKKPTTKCVQVASSKSKGVIRSTRAQDLRSQSNRDLLKPKTTTEKIRTVSPYLTALPQKKKKCSNAVNSEPKTITRSNNLKTVEEKKKVNKVLSKSEKGSRPGYKGKTKKEKPATAGDSIPLQRQRTQEIINPKIVKKSNSTLFDVKAAAGDSEFPQLKKSQTFFICKGTKGGDHEKPVKEVESNYSVQPVASESVGSDGNHSDNETLSPKPKPLTHNDSFCLIVKSSQSWSQKNRSDDEKWIQYGLTYEEKSRKPQDKGILKNGSYDLKSVDSIENVESEKIVRFSDELTRNKKVLKKLVRRKKRLQNYASPSWYQKNKLFQKYLQILREKSVLLTNPSDLPEDLKPFQIPQHVKEKYEAEMFGLPPRKGKFAKTKNTYSY